MHLPIILFDFDGVIITQRALKYTALKLLKNDWYDWQNTKELRLIDFARLFEESDKESRYDSLRTLYQAYKKYIPSRWKRWVYFSKFNRLYQKYEKLYDTVKSDLKQILDTLQFQMGIVSNTAKKRLEYFLQKFSLKKYFSVALSREDGGKIKKPNPYPLLLALVKIKKKFNLSAVNKNRVYFIGDLPTDIQCAKAAKVKSIALLSGHGRKQDLEQSNPDYIIEHIKDLLELKPFQKFF